MVHPQRQGMPSSDEKPNQDKDAAKTKLSHSTEIRPPLVSLANPREAVRWRSLQAELAKFHHFASMQGAKPGLAWPRYSEE